MSDLYKQFYELTMQCNQAQAFLTQAQQRLQALHSAIQQEQKDENASTGDHKTDSPGKLSTGSE